MKYIIYFLLLSYVNGFSQSKNDKINFSIASKNNDKYLMLVTKMSSKNSNSTIRLTSPPIISDEDASQNDYKILLRRKTRKGFQKVSAPCCIHPQPSFDSTNLEFNKPILDTFSPMFYYSLRKGTYKAKVIRHVNSDGKKIFISSNWIHFTIYKDQTL